LGGPWGAADSGDRPAGAGRRRQGRLEIFVGCHPGQTVPAGRGIIIDIANGLSQGRRGQPQDKECGHTKTNAQAGHAINSAAKKGGESAATGFYWSVSMKAAERGSTVFRMKIRAAAPSSTDRDLCANEANRIGEQQMRAAP